MDNTMERGDHYRPMPNKDPRSTLFPSDGPSADLSTTMNHIYITGDLYGHTEFFPSEHIGSSEWSANPSVSMPMARELSGGSAATAFSNELVQTPITEYESSDNSWSHASSGGPGLAYDHSFPPADYSPPPISEPGALVVDCGGYYDPREHETWRPYYDSMVVTEPVPQAYWSLKPSVEPLGQLSPTRVVDGIFSTGGYRGPHSPTQEGGFTCTKDGCTKTFRRKSDLDRHHSQMHTPLNKKTKYPCDWKRCQRAHEPFHRRDHQRDHLRCFHHEDLMRRGSSGGEDPEWWSNRTVNLFWWRCSHCLRRIKTTEHGYTCPKCKTECEPARKRYREELHGQNQLGLRSSSSSFYPPIPLS